MIRPAGFFRHNPALDVPPETDTQSVRVQEQAGASSSSSSPCCGAPGLTRGQAAAAEPRGASLAEADAAAEGEEQAGGGRVRGFLLPEAPPAGATKTSSRRQRAATTGGVALASRL